MKKYVLLGVIIVTTLHTYANVTLPHLFTDNMVLQRNKPVAVWGWAGRGETVVVTFNGQSVKGKANSSGLWSVHLTAMKHGGPYEMTIRGKSNVVSLKNILMGDVWVCSGQSNMEWQLKDTNHAEQEIAGANHPAIRFFTVAKSISFSPQADVTGGQWQVCTPVTANNFSAVAYFFGRKLNQDLEIPIGLINTSWGGTNIQAWLSWDVMSRDDAYKNLTPAAYKEMIANQGAKQAAYLEALKQDKGITEKWFEPTTSATDWKTITLPAAWESSSIGNTDGIVWFRKEVKITQADLASGDAIISLGPVDDWDATYINGKLVGGEYNWNEARRYKIPAGVLIPGVNTIVVKVTDNQGGGGLYGKPEQMFLEAGTSRTSLAGDWTYKLSVTSAAYGVTFIGPNEFPSQLFNAMVSPLASLSMAGTIWYQGEANTYQAYRYRALLPALIQDWRKHFNDALPFYWVQLANFMEPVQNPAESEWAELREAQNMTLSVPHSGQAVAIDIGEAKDIHPRNKQDVGLRLALVALKDTYGKSVVSSGPRFQAMTLDGNKAVLTFTETGTGLKAKDKYGYLKGFAIAGNDHKFFWANAFIEGDHVVVSSEHVQNPVAVRYGWGDNPDDANLYNQEDLPASPFRTDQWKGLTQNK